MNKLEIKNLIANKDDEEIIKGLSLSIKAGETHLLMGPNGSGKSTLSQILIRNPLYQVREGSIVFCGNNLLNLKPWEVLDNGLFVSFQNPYEISGLSTFSYLRMLYNKRCKRENTKVLSPFKFKEILSEKLKELKIDEKFLERSLNEGFSGGEKKKMEILQMLLSNPSFIVLDEIDSGLDFDSLKIVFNVIKTKLKTAKIGALVITHYPSIVDHIDFDQIHIIKDGKIVESGQKNIIEKLENKGYTFFKKDGRS